MSSYAENGSSDARGTIEIVAHASLLLSLLVLARWRRLSIDIDGQLGRFRWGVHAFTVAPGDHAVTVGLGGWFSGKAATTVHVATNETVRLRYTPHWIKNLSGSLEVERLPPARVVPP